MPPTRDTDLLNRALHQKLKELSRVSGQLTFPCLPAMLDNYMERIRSLANSLDVDLRPGETEKLREVIDRHLADGFRASPWSLLVVKYEPSVPEHGLACGILFKTSVQPGRTLAAAYEQLMGYEGPNPFGAHPEAKVMALASELGDPPATPVLDVGAGTGRNAIALARLGHPVHAVENVSAFERQIRSALQREALPLTLTDADIFDDALQIPSGHFRLAIASQFTIHFRQRDQVTALLSRMCNALAPGGMLLFNQFLAADGYEPDAAARQLAAASWSFLLTRTELHDILKALPLDVVSDESMLEYEQSHQPAENWPPTKWFHDWATGRNIFPMKQSPPVELRWILARKR